MKNKSIILTIMYFMIISSSFSSTFQIKKDLTEYFKTPEQLKWGNPHLFEKGAHDSVMYMKPDGGAYTVRVKFPTNFRVKPFYQSGEIYLTVLSGKLYINSGSEFKNKEKGYELPEGSFFSIPKNVAIYMWTTGQPATIQMHSPKFSKIIKINHED